MFQLQLVNGPEWRNAWALASGVILVPRQIGELMQNDSQLAAVLADGVSSVLEKQTYREQPSNTAKALNELGSLAGGWAVLGAVTCRNRAMQASLWCQTPDERPHEGQRGRVALSWMHDAGYDLNEAPKAWWLISAKDRAHCRYCIAKSQPSTNGNK